MGTNQGQCSEKKRREIEKKVCANCWGTVNGEERQLSKFLKKLKNDERDYSFEGRIANTTVGGHGKIATHWGEKEGTKFRR